MIHTPIAIALRDRTVIVLYIGTTLILFSDVVFGKKKVTVMLLVMPIMFCAMQGFR